MPNFTAKVRVDYQDIDGLVLDCRQEDLPLNVGTHTGANNVAILTDSSKAWTPDSLIGGIVYNLTDSSSGTITDNDANTVTATLAGGGDNDWDTGDAYAIMLPDFEWVNRAPPARVLIEGSHNGANNAATLFDSTRVWRADRLVGCTVYNVTDGSSGIVTANTVNSVTAVLAGGVDNDWDTNDLYALTTPRFGNPFQGTVANCPIVTQSGGFRQADFNRADSHFLKIPLDYGFSTREWAIAFEFAKGADNTNQQTVVLLESGVNDLVVFRRDGAGNYGYTWASGVGDMPDGVWITAYASSVNIKMYNDGPEVLSGVALELDVPAAAAAGFIGSNDGATWFADMVLNSVKVWDRRISPQEIDFAFQSLAMDGTDNSVQDRATMSREPWLDEVSPYSRVNPTVNAPHRYIKASISTGDLKRVQVVGQVGGRTLPDADLGGDLFSLTPIEMPGAPPAVFQDAGWSSVFDVVCSDEGHYSYLLSRPDGGGVIVHWDVEVT
jgi:hypothetical protein